MSDIDPEKLEAVIERTGRCSLTTGPCYVQAEGHWLHVSQAELNMLRAAARAHLATLPRFKEVEVVRWGVIDHRGKCFRSEITESDAREWLKNDSAWQVVRLTGTAKVKVSP